MLKDLILAAAFMLAPALAGAQTPMPDFTRLVREQAATVVNVSGTARIALPQLSDLPEEERGDSEALREFLWRFFGPEAAPESRTLGAGFVISEDGYIVTNAHLVAGEEERDIVVRLADRREFPARIVGADRTTDIALIKIEARGLRRARIGDPASLEPGEWVAAIGSPFGFERSITAGIVSAVGRTLPEESYVPFIQTDVAVNPGNSGGPLFNLHGEVIGVNSLIYSQSGGYMGLSFAIPVDVAMEVAAQLRAHGKVRRGRIGVRLQEVNAELARALRLKQLAGALVVEVFRGSNAELAGLRPGDVILRFGAIPVESHADLVRMTARTAPGTTVELQLIRDAAPLRIRVAVSEAVPAPAARAKGRGTATLAFGLYLAPLDALQRERLDLDGGLLVHGAAGPGQRAGLQPGDLVLSVNGHGVATVQEFNLRVEEARPQGSAALLVQREGVRSFVALPLSQ